LVITDITFARRAGRALEATLFQPDGVGPFPAVVSVHGGAWTSGDRTGTVDVDAALRAAGIIVLAADFRMPPEAGYPAAVDDVRDAVRWLTAHASEVNARPEAIGILGSSSGGQTALLCALLPDADAPLAFAALCWPISDPHARYRMAQAKANEKLVAAHDAYFGDEATMSAASPQRIVEAGEARALPPIVTVQGTADENVTADMAQRFTDAYRRAGGEATLHFFEGQPHSFIKNGGDEAAQREATRRIAEFINAQGRVLVHASEAESHRDRQ
jgi:acetyl esterase/lipase